MNNEESVPTRTPIVITSEKAKIDLPPRITKASKTSNVVPDVIRVLLSVTFNEWLTTSTNFILRNTLVSSRILSKTIIVSFKEYPMIVIIAPTTWRSIWTGNPSLWNRAKIPIVIITSWISPTTAPRANLNSNRSVM